MSSSAEELPCLFCFSLSSSSPQGYHYHPGDKTRLERVYRFMCDLLGVKIINPEEDYFSVFDDGQQPGSMDSYFPLCVHCCLLFQNLGELQEQLVSLQEKINTVALEIRGKVNDSEQDGSPALAIAIHSMGQSYAASQATSNRLAWMQRFRHKVNQRAGVAGESSSGLNQTHHYVIVPAVDIQPIQIVQDGYTVTDAPVTYYLGPDVITSTPQDDDPRDGDDNVHDSNFYIQSSDPDWSERSEADSPPPAKSTPQKRLRVSPKSIKTVSKRSPPTKRARKNSKSPTKAKRIRKKSNPNKAPAIPDELKKYRCHVCSKGFNLIYNLKVHLPTHTGQKNFSCDLCNEKFISRNVVARHNQAVHGSKLPFCCPVCKLRRATNSSLQWHMKTHDYNIPTKPPYKCPKCNNGKEYQNKLILRRHLYAHYNPNKFPCAMCPSKFSRRDDVMSHMARKHRNQVPEEGKKFQCTKCPFEFDDSNKLITHLWSHGRQKAPLCQICRISFQTITDLDIHCEQVHGKQVTRFPCSSCDFVFTSVSQLRHHNKLHESVEKTRLDVLCTICNKTYYDNAALKKHIKLIHEDHGRPFVCSHEGCGRTYKRNEDLRKHLKAHTKKEEKLKEASETSEDVDLKCSQCDIVFKNRQNLRRHVLSIHEERKVQCDICSQLFKRKDELLKHKRRKHGPDQDTTTVVETDHYCEICKKYYSARDSLKKHIKIVHEMSGADRFPCCKCEKTFKRDDDRKKHEKKVHGVVHELYKRREISNPKLSEGFACETCGTFYKSMHNLRKHEEEVHGASVVVRKQKIQVVLEGGEVVTQEVQEEERSVTPVVGVEKNKEPDQEGEIVLKTYPKKAQCKLCDKSFFSNNTLRRHVLLQHGKLKTQRPFSCDMCEKSYKRNDDLRKHERVVHGKLIPSSRGRQPQSPQPDTFVHACPYCTTVWTTKQRLKLHIASHTGLKEHIKPVAANGTKKKVGSFFKIVVTTSDGSTKTVDPRGSRSEEKSANSSKQKKKPGKSKRKAKPKKKVEKTVSTSRMSTRSSAKRAAEENELITDSDSDNEDRDEDGNSDMSELPETSKKSRKPKKVVKVQKSKRTKMDSNSGSGSELSDVEYFPIASTEEEDSDYVEF